MLGLLPWVMRYRSWSEFQTKFFPCTLYRINANQRVCKGNGIGLFQPQDQLNTHNPYSMTNTNGIFGLFFRRSEAQSPWSARGKSVSPSAGTIQRYLIWRIKCPTSVSTLNLRRLRWRVRDVTGWTSIHGHNQTIMRYLVWRKAKKPLLALCARRALKFA